MADVVICLAVLPHLGVILCRYNIKYFKVKDLS
jgi:hypothetical protein